LSWLSLLFTIGELLLPENGFALGENRKVGGIELSRKIE
jgi:hypothetical protein